MRGRRRQHGTLRARGGRARGACDGARALRRLPLRVVRTQRLFGVARRRKQRQVKACGLEAGELGGKARRQSGSFGSGFGGGDLGGDARVLDRFQPGSLLACRLLFGGDARVLDRFQARSLDGSKAGGLLGCGLLGGYACVLDGFQAGSLDGSKARGFLLSRDASIFNGLQPCGLDGCKPRRFLFGGNARVLNRLQPRRFLPRRLLGR